MQTDKILSAQSAEVLEYTDCISAVAKDHLLQVT